MKLTFSAVLLIVSFNLFSQKAPVKFGDVPKEDVTMTLYPADSSAEAVVLVDYGESTISYTQMSGFKLNFERIRRIKILKKDALGWADFEIPLYHDGAQSEKTSSIKGITYNFENGKVVETKLEKSGIFREKRDDNVDIVKITFPNVKEGSVIELTYDVVSDFLFNFQDWDFQTTIPVKWSEYRAHIPEYFRYNKNHQGYIAMHINENSSSQQSIMFTDKEKQGFGSTTFSSDQVNYSQNSFRWVAKDVPAFKEEPFMTTYKDYISRVNFELASIHFPNQPIRPVMGSWDDINKTFYELYQPEIKGNGFLSKTVEEVIAGSASNSDKVAAICNYVKTGFSWDQTTSKYMKRTLKKMMEDKQGNAAEINILLASLLEKAGFTVNPVLVSTRDHGLIRQTSPQSAQFNYVICLVKVDDKEILLDATERLLSINLLPERCLNGAGLVLQKETFRWVDLETKLKTKSFTSVEFSLLPSMELSGKLKSDYTGYAALKKRKVYLNKGEEEYLKDFTSNHQWELSKSVIRNAREVHNNFVEEHELKVSENITAAGDVVYLDPFVTSALKSNPFKTENREYPVNFGSPSESTYMYKFTVPDDYNVDELPKSRMIALPANGGKYLYSVAQNANIITITSVLSINKSLFTQEEYPVLKEFYNQVVAKQTEQIVLKKK